MKTKMGVKIRIYGEIEGPIWLPPVTCTKEFDLILEKIPADLSRTYPGIAPRSMQIHCLRDALLHITNDGDFQNTSIVWACLEITRHYTNKDQRVNKTVTRTWELQGNDGNGDCYLKE